MQTPLLLLGTYKGTLGLWEFAREHRYEYYFDDFERLRRNNMRERVHSGNVKYVFHTGCVVLLKELF